MTDLADEIHKLRCDVLKLQGMLESHIAWESNTLRVIYENADTAYRQILNIKDLVKTNECIQGK
jgi:hypothetical protein